MTATEPLDLRHCPAAAWRSRLGALRVAGVLVSMSLACAGDAASPASSAEPWGTNTVTPAELVKELAGASGAEKPIVICTAPAVLHRVGHIPGAILRGPASSPDGLSDLTAWARTLPRATSLVVYCGCCPINVCPNLQPAYSALKGLNFTRVRVLILPDSFRADWVERGYPVER